MLISFYHISLCPRCARVRKHLRNFLGDSYSVYVKEINVAMNPLKAWGGGIRMVPALTCGEDLLSGVILTRKSLEQFLERNGYLNR